MSEIYCIFAVLLKQTLTNTHHSLEYWSYDVSEGVGVL